MVEDFLITKEGTETVTLPNQCTHLADRTDLYAMTDCPSPKLAPLYQCPKHTLCSPFAPVKDKQLVQACVDCEDYESGDKK